MTATGTRLAPLSLTGSSFYCVLNAIELHVVGVSADSLDIARGIGERDGEAFSDRPKTGVRDDPGFDPPLSFDARQSQLARMTVPCALASFRRLARISAFNPLLKFKLGHYRLFCDVAKPEAWAGEVLTDAAHQRRPLSGLGHERIILIYNETLFSEDSRRARRAAALSRRRGSARPRRDRR